MSMWIATIVMVSVVYLLGGCEVVQDLPEGAATAFPGAGDGDRATVVRPTWGAADPYSGGRIEPQDLSYLGAFRLPEGAWPEGIGWEYSGSALAYSPTGDPAGPDDGFPGSLYATGHDWNQYVAEISIPVPVDSADQDLEVLNRATMLQDFHDIRGDLFAGMDFELPRAGLEVLPPQGEQTAPKLYFCWGYHMQQYEYTPSHGWCELDLSDPQSAGAWLIGGLPNIVTNDYLFAVPPEWDAGPTTGMLLATGRYRDGGQGAQGPSLLLIGPWNEGNPPPPGSTIPALPLLLYSDVTVEDGATLDGYHHSDEWAGGAWLTAGDRSAVVLAGTKGEGACCWYGFANGVVWPEEGPWPPVPDPPNDQRGWWSDRFVGQLLFYDPADLAAVAHGEMRADQPQPYATMEMDGYLYGIESEQQLHHTGAVAFDRERGLLYIVETCGDGDRPLIHVWQVR